MPKLGRRFEPQQLQYYYNSTSATSNAPFGNDHTPWLKSRIVGSKLRPVLERRANPQGGVTPRFYPQIVDPIAEKPNNVNPHMLAEYTRKLASVNQRLIHSIHHALKLALGRKQVPTPQHDEEFCLPKPTAYGRRPDSKDLGQRWSSLPPIDQNKTKNEYSTIFEPEPWTKMYRNNDNNLTQRSQQFQQPFDSGQYGGTGGGIGSVANGYQSPVLFEPPPPPPPPAPKFEPTPREMLYREEDQREYQDEPQRRMSHLEMLKSELLQKLPNNIFLPEHPLHLSREQEESVLKMVAEELCDADPSRLRDVYLDITGNYDRALSGWCHYQNLILCLSNHKFALSSDLQRIIAAMFVSPSKLQEVNYEKFLSFIGTSMKDSPGHGWPLELYSPRSKAQEKQYYEKENPVMNQNSWVYPSPRASRPSSPYFDSNVGKLLNMTEQQLQNDGIDFERLVVRFQECDREFRETLSAEQIKGVLWSQGVRLQDSVVNKILDKCAQDGQYNWLRFVEFLEKVQPAKTSLHLPRSKKPLEYAKKVPSPGPNWPHAASSNNAPLLDTVAPLWKKDEHYDYDRKGSEMYNQEQEQLRENRDRIQTLDKELRHLEADYQDMKKKLNSPRGDSPWFKMFMEFANALYKQDQKSTGRLPVDEVLNWTNMYNSSYNLDIPDDVMIRTLGDCTEGGRVNIHSYLTRLGAQDWRHNL